MITGYIYIRNNDWYKSNNVYKIHILLVNYIEGIILRYMRFFYYLKKSYKYL